MFAARERGWDLLFSFGFYECVVVGISNLIFCGLVRVTRFEIDWVDGVLFFLSSLPVPTVCVLYVVLDEARKKWVRKIPNKISLRLDTIFFDSILLFRKRLLDRFCSTQLLS